MDKIRIHNCVEDNDLEKSTAHFTQETEEEGEDDDYGMGYLDDEPIRKPKGKKIRKMRSNFDR